MKFHIASDKLRLFSYFILLSFCGAFALQVPCAYVEGNVVPFIDALFTSVSAVCVTGLSTVDMSVYTTFGFVIILLLIELGGLGILTFISMMIALPSKKVSLVNRRMVRNFFIDDVEANPRKILNNIFLFTLVIQGIGAVFLFPVLKQHNVQHPLFDAVFISVSAFCNAGFSPYSDGLVGFRDSISMNVIIALLIISGGIGFIVLQNILQVLFRRKKTFSLHTKIVLTVTGGLILSGALVTFIADYNNALAGLSLPQKIMAVFFESITARTAGFETFTQNSFSAASNLFTCFLMFIGGSPGSIAGGIKTTTFMIVVLYVIAGNEEKVNMSFSHRTIDPRTTGKALAIVSRSMAIIFFSIFLLTLTELEALRSGAIELLDIFFETFSAFATVGLTRGLTPQLTVPSKVIIILTMFIGRTGIFAMALHMREQTVQKFIEYPEESILIG